MEEEIQPLRSYISSVDANNFICVGRCSMTVFYASYTVATLINLLVLWTFTILALLVHLFPRKASDVFKHYLHYSKLKWSNISSRSSLHFLNETLYFSTSTWIYTSDWQLNCKLFENVGHADNIYHKTHSKGYVSSPMPSVVWSPCHLHTSILFLWIKITES